MKVEMGRVNLRLVGAKSTRCLNISSGGFRVRFGLGRVALDARAFNINMAKTRDFFA